MEILFEQRGEFGVITLNRPEALNALTFEMCAAMRARLMEWERAGAIRAVLVRGAASGREGHARAFSAGGDVIRATEIGRADLDKAASFFHEEYRLNALIHHYSKPYVALIDGVVMGGGAGLSVHGDFRVAGDHTLFAMPEMQIGLFPDVGGGYFLSRLHDGLGYYYALTGARAKAADCMATGIATHYAPSDQLEALERELYSTSLGGHPHARIEEVLDGFAGDPGEAHVNQIRPALKRLFDGKASFAEFWAGLEADGHDVAGDMRRILSRMSPTSMRVAFEQLARARTLDFDDEMRMEYRIVRRCLEGHDFYEGVRAQLIDKDKTPRWSPARVDDVRDADVARYFEPLAKELTLP